MIPWSLNRTFVELKPDRDYWGCVAGNVLIEPLWNWNCSTVTIRTWTTQVLIEPLWNWNFSERHSSSRPSRLNRTFVELKRRHNCQVVPEYRRLNRTFVELKLGMTDELVISVNVLIEPLWNWNNCWKASLFVLMNVLIEPLWNWNRGRTPFCALPWSLNRTFVELKLW